MLSLRRSRHLFACSLFVLLAACGGGSDGGAPQGPTLQAPPESPASLSQSPSEASLGVQAAVSGGAAVSQQDAGPGSAFLPSADPFSGRSGDALAWSRAGASTREQAMAVTTLACTDLLLGLCSGNVSVDTNIEGSITVIPAGSYFSISFNGLAGTLEGESFSLSGSVRVDYLSAFDAAATSLFNTQFQVTATDVSGIENGVPFGPESQVMLATYDAQGNVAVTTDGRTFSELSGVVVIDDDNYSIGSARLRTAAWGNADAYVDVRFQSWNVGNGRPTIGSSLTITGAGGNSIVAVVTASSASSVVYDVQVNVGGAVKRYTVTATYAGTGAPTYAAVEVTG